MNKTLHISGVIAFIAIVVMRVIPYFEGAAFDKYWSIPMGVLPVGLIAFLTFTITAIVCMIAIVRKKQISKNFYIIVLFPLLITGLYFAPFPSYVDGMRKTVAESLSKQELSSFALEAKSTNIDWNKHEEHNKIIERLKANHPTPLSLSPIPPRINVKENYVSVFYGSALVKHWGYVVSDLNEFPIEHIPENMYREVFKGVWVYHDIW